MTAPSPTVSVVVLSYDRPHYLREALASITAQTQQPAEVLVVDNRSPRSGEVADVVAEFPGVRLIAQSVNAGFTGGMNAGLRAASGEYVCLSEDDIVLAPTALAALTAHAARNPGGLTGAVMHNKSDGTIRCAGGRIRLGTRFQMEVIGENQPDDGQFHDPFPVTYLPGAFLFAHRLVWARLGGFRDLYYMYMEDVDLCLRAARTGVRIDVAPGARVWHFDPPSGPTPTWLGCLKARNFLRLYVLNAPARVLPAFFLRYGLWWPVRDLAQGRRRGWGGLRALAAVLFELPRLLRQRWGRPVGPVAVRP